MTTSLKKHLFNGYCNWLWENGETPYVIVVADHPRTAVPAGYVKTMPIPEVASNGSGIVNVAHQIIVLNLSQLSINNFKTHEDGVSFSARFNQKSVPLYVPYDAVLAVYPHNPPAGFPEDRLDWPYRRPSEQDQAVPEVVQTPAVEVPQEAPVKARPSFLRVVK